MTDYFLIPHQNPESLGTIHPLFSEEVIGKPWGCSSGHLAEKKQFYTTKIIVWASSGWIETMTPLLTGCVGLGRCLASLSPVPSLAMLEVITSPSASRQDEQLKVQVKHGLCLHGVHWHEHWLNGFWAEVGHVGQSILLFQVWIKVSLIKSCRGGGCFWMNSLSKELLCFKTEEGHGTNTQVNKLVF